MNYCREIARDSFYIGVEDRRSHLFENLFPLERGVSYNSYVILDEKTCLMDTCDEVVGRQFLENMTAALAGRTLDYLVIHHMEPDHCSMALEVMNRYPEVTVVGSQKTFQMLDQFFSLSLRENHKQVVKEGEELSLGKHTLRFLMAPMVHWPEVMFSYDTLTKALYTADAFGVFGCNNGNVFAEETDTASVDFRNDARRYYANICGKYGMQVQTALKKASALELELLCPLHGPVWKEKRAEILSLYDSWSKYEAEERAVAVIYNSVYGNTESVVNSFAMELGKSGIRNIRIYDVSKTDPSYLIAECFRVSHLVIGATTYNNGLFPKMEGFLQEAAACAVQNRKYALLENGSWAVQSGKLVRGIFDTMKNMEQIGETLTIKSSSFRREALSLLAKEVADSVKA